MSRPGLPVKGSLKILIGLLALVFLQSCGSTEGTTSPVTVTIGSPAGNLKSVSISKSQTVGAYKFAFTISGPNMTDIISVVPATQSGITVVFNVPNGDSRHFVVEYQDSNGTPLYRGESYADLNGQEVSLQIIMQSLGTLVGGAIQGITLNPAGDVSTLDGSAGIQGTADGYGSDARFNGPGGVTTNGTHLYVTDAGNNSVRKIDIWSGEVETVAATGFTDPRDITTDGVNLYVLDTGNNSIRQIDIVTEAGSTLASGFNGPRGITTDGVNLYVSDTGNNSVKKVVIATGAVSTVAAGFNSPTGITTDGVNLYVNDAGNNSVKKVVIATGAVSTVATGFNSPAGITTDGVSLYVTDIARNIVLKVDIAAGSVSVLAGSGAPGSADGAGTFASFNSPSGITTDGSGLYLTDTNNNTVRYIK